MTTINERAAELFAIHKNKKMVEAHLLVEGHPAKAISEALKSLGVTKRKSFASEYYDFLSSAPRTKEEAEKYIMGEGEYGETTPNIYKTNKKHYLNIWKLTAKIWEQKVRDPELDAAWEYIEALQSKLNQGRSPTKTDRMKSHPDKVARFNDSALTKAYTETNKRVNDYFDRKNKAA